MSLYPSLEDMKVGQMLEAQQAEGYSAPNATSTLPYPTSPSHHLPSAPSPAAVVNLQHAYPELGEYMGLELTPEEIALNMPEYLQNNQTALALAGNREVSAISESSQSLYPHALSAPLSGSSVGLARAQVSHGVRQVVLCKDEKGMVGMRVKAINKGVFVCLVTKGSPAAKGGLRFGDQILQINGTNVAGYSSDKVHDILKKAGDNNIVMAVRDRPFERTLTLHKDSTGHIGFQFKEGKINSIAVESSAARNGLLIDHNLLEVNGQNVVGVKDKEISQIIDDGGNIITITIIPTFIYTRIMKNMSNSLVKKMMDHSIPDM